MKNNESEIDPFFLIKEEIEANVLNIEKKHSNLLILFGQISQEEFERSFNNLKESVESLFRDLKMLSESIDVTEANPARYNVSNDEIEKRRALVRLTEQKIQKIQESLNSMRERRESLKMRKERLMKVERRNQASKVEDEIIAYNQRSIEEQIQEQVNIVKQQDERLDTLHEVTGRLNEMSIEMGHEIDDSNHLIEKMTKQVDKNQRKIGILTKSIDKLRNSQHKGKLCLIVILLCILIGLIIMLIHTIL
ncbi:Syntaxin 6D [Monocercomonoides exilis]|uniref:Syntaxin 6D n=1 Tax=Monocercomonoides exilis TaxID=2049356 RepID=UPI00355A7B8D|nr:Syntaxin 6D [Monocercomonoides exilis]